MTKIEADDGIVRPGGCLFLYQHEENTLTTRSKRMRHRYHHLDQLLPIFGDGVNHVEVAFDDEANGAFGIMDL